jgi:hypothetical protein
MTCAMWITYMASASKPEISSVANPFVKEYEAADWGVSENEKRYIEKRAQYELIMKRNDSAVKIQQLRAALGPVVKLQSDYFGTDSYYYNSENDTIYVISNHCTPMIRAPTTEEDFHIRTLNSICISSALQEVHAEVVNKQETLQRLIKEDPLIALRATFETIINTCSEST